MVSIIIIISHPSIYTAMYGKTVWGKLVVSVAMPQIIRALSKNIYLNCLHVYALLGLLPFFCRFYALNVSEPAEKLQQSLVLSALSSLLNDSFKM